MPMSCHLARPLLHDRTQWPACTNSAAERAHAPDRRKRGLRFPRAAGPRRQVMHGVSHRDSGRNMLKYSDIFVPGGFPRHTYNPRQELQLGQKLREADQNLCKLVTVTGHTKSGKTVLARTVFPREDAIWIDGGIVSQEDDFWGVVLEQLDLFQNTQQQSQQGTTSTITGKGAA